MLTGMDDRKVVKAQIGDGVAHRRREFWGGRVFDFKTPAPVATHHEEVEFRAAVGRPEEAFLSVGTQMADQLIDNKALPGGTLEISVIATENSMYFIRGEGSRRAGHA
jgi:hypothetical protein